MKRWGWALLAAVVACLPILLTRASHRSLLEDTDTRVLITRMEQRAAPLSWFTGDWPLENHFYRPVTTLTFELDQELHPWDPAGYGLTNALLAVLCVVGLFWFVRELTESPAISAASATLFALWIAVPHWVAPFSSIFVGLGLVGLVGSLLPKQRFIVGAAALLVCAYAGTELVGMVPIRGGALDWIPGRTATTMTVFCLAAMAMYARFERLTAPKPLPPPTSLDRPATKGTELRPRPGRSPWLWVVGAFCATLAALGAYEQAVMVPAVLAGVAVSFRLRGYRPHVWPHFAFWGALGVYVLARKAFVPSSASGYQLQQYRSSVDVALTLGDYAFPPARTLLQVFQQAELGIANLFMTQYAALFVVLAGICGLVFIWGKRPSPVALPDRMPLIAMLLSTIAFLPMAWFKPFPSYNHYHFWPMALRALFAVTLAAMAVRVVVAAVAPKPIRLES